MSMRKVHFSSTDVWEYGIGRTNVVIKSPTGKKTVVGFDQVTGLSWNDLERGAWKKTVDGMVRPAQVKSYIDGHRIELG